MQRNIFLWLENEWISKEINWLWQYDKYDEYDKYDKYDKCDYDK